MKVISSFLIFIGVLLPLCLFSYILLPFNVFLGFGVLCLLAWIVLFQLLDRVLLFYLGAREIIDADEVELFESIKSHSYRYGLPLPKVFVYFGEAQNTFLFEGLTSWSIVIEQDLLRQLDREGLDKLISYYYESQNHNRYYLKTKALGVNVLCYSNSYWLLKKIFAGQSQSHMFKVIALFLLSLLHTLLRPLEWILNYNRSKHFEYSNRFDVTFSDLFTKFLFNNTTYRRLIVEYMERYSIHPERELGHNV